MKKARLSPIKERNLACLFCERSIRIASGHPLQWFCLVAVQDP